MTTNEKYRFLGTTDECVKCQQCGRTELHSTVVLAALDADGNTEDITYFGSSCAARALGIKGGGRAVSKAAEGARLKTLMTAHDGRRTLRKYGIPETGGLPADDFPLLMAFAKNNPGAARCATGITDLRSMMRDVVENAQRWIAEAVLVAGTEWGKDPQPLNFGYRSAIKDTME